MRYHELKEYQVRVIKPLNPIEFDGDIVGNISAGKYVFNVHKITEDFEVIYKAVLRNGDDESPKCTLGFNMMSVKNVLMMKNAWTDPDFRRIGLASELTHFVNKLDPDGKQVILSDTVLSPEGERLWNSLVKSNNFVSKIHDFATHHTYDISILDSHQELNPKNDNQYEFMWNNDTKTGQRYFYLLETNKFKGFDNDGNEILCEASRSSHRPYKLLNPFSYFGEGCD